MQFSEKMANNGGGGGEFMQKTEDKRIDDRTGI